MQNAMEPRGGKVPEPSFGLTETVDWEIGGASGGRTIAPFPPLQSYFSGRVQRTFPLSPSTAAVVYEPTGIVTLLSAASHRLLTRLLSEGDSLVTRLPDDFPLEACAWMGHYGPNLHPFARDEIAGPQRFNDVRGDPFWRAAADGDASLVERFARSAFFAIRPYDHAMGITLAPIPSSREAHIVRLESPAYGSGLVCDGRVAYQG